jgi:hypothetical protein
MFPRCRVCTSKAHFGSRKAPKAMSHPQVSTVGDRWREDLCLPFYGLPKGNSAINQWEEQTVGAKCLLVTVLH